MYCTVLVARSNTRRTDGMLHDVLLYRQTINNVAEHWNNKNGKCARAKYRQTDRNSVVVTVRVTFCVCFFRVTCLFLCITFIRENKAMRSACYLFVLHTSPRILDHLTELRKFCMNFMIRGVEKTT